VAPLVVCLALVLLLAVGVAVTEITHWGRRQQEAANQREGYLGDIETTAAAVAAGDSSPSALIDTVCDHITAVLGLSRCRFDYGTGLGLPRLEADGRLRRDRQLLDVETSGLPTDVATELVVESGGRFMGRFLLTAGPDTHPPVCSSWWQPRWPPRWEPRCVPTATPATWTDSAVPRSVSPAKYTTSDPDRRRP
jgi:hypothetical protein